MTIEVELRSFITKEQYEALIDFFKTNSKTFSYDDQMTYYLDAPVDIRIQKNLDHSKIWMKKGRMHSSSREEIEVKFDKDDFERLEQMFLLMGYDVKVKWFRKRYMFYWRDFEVCVDSNKGYGYILEIEKRTDEAGKEEALSAINAAFKELGVKVTPKKVFDEAYANYLKNWQKLTK